MLALTHLKDEAEIGRGPVLVLVLVAVVHVHMLELNEARQVTGYLPSELTDTQGKLDSLGDPDREE